MNPGEPASFDGRYFGPVPRTTIVGRAEVNVNASQGMTMLPHGKLHPDSMSFVCLAIPSSRPVGFGAIVVVRFLPIANPGPGEATRLRSLSTTTTAVIFLPGRKFNGARSKQWTS